jgi:hypothetical protein
MFVVEVVVVVEVRGRILKLPKLMHPMLHDLHWRQQQLQQPSS